MIYYVEDDKNIRELVVYTLIKAGYEAQGLADAKSFYEKIEIGLLPELVLLDIMLPNEDGLSILKHIKSDVRTSSVPVIMITAKAAEYDKASGLDLGADDYIAKPFGMVEFVARVRAMLRRSAKTPLNVFTYDNLTIDEQRYSAFVDGEKISLTPKEFELIKCLMQNAGKVFSREELLEKIWGFDFEGTTRAVDVAVAALRGKLKSAKELIKTVRGTGYRFGK